MELGAITRSCIAFEVLSNQVQNYSVENFPNSFYTRTLASHGCKAPAESNVGQVIIFNNEKQPNLIQY
jgi:hypothetical protein